MSMDEKGHTSTDDERESLINSYGGWDFVEVALNPNGASRVINDLLARLEAALRRPEAPEPQSEPSDVQVDAGARALFDEMLRGSSIGDVGGTFERCRDSARIVLRAAGGVR